jgi:hopanoid-associated phosphorylase
MKDAAAMPAPLILAVVGMQSEAALLPEDVRVLVTGGDPKRAAALLAGHHGEVGGVLSFGIAGGLDPALAAGDLVVATRVRGPGGAWQADMAWAAALAGATGARLGTLAGAARVVADPAAKRKLHAATGGALAVDLESEAAAAFAAARGLPFAALRAVADTAAESVPQAAAGGLTADGRPAAARVALALLRRPGELPAVLQVARRARVALAALERAAKALPGR